MEPSQIFGDAEECHSSESGWTMYIGSPIHGDDDDDDDDDGDGDDEDHDNDGGGDDDDDADDSDDSMASDASSGPSHHFKNKKDEEDGKYCLDKKAMKPVEKQRDKRWNKEDEKVPSPVQESGSKVRKNIWIGKKK